MAFPYPHKMKKTMIELGIADKTIAKFDCFDSKNFKQEEVIPFIVQMEKLLTQEQCLSIMERQGCCKTGKNDVANKEFGLKYKNKILAEKVELLAKADIPYKVPCELNKDGTLSIFWGAGQDGDYKCVCSGIKKLTDLKNIPKTYCGCCGGHVRHNYQNALGVGLRLKEIVSSSISTNGKKRCEFLFEVINP